MLPSTSPRKKLKSPGQDTLPNPKTTIMCTNVPESLFEPNAATKHFSKFGRVMRIKLFPRKQACLIEFDQPSAIERAVLNAGAYDGFMFDVTRMKARVRKRSKAEDDPDWVPDSDVAQELSAMRGGPSIATRNKSMDVSPDNVVPKILRRTIRQTVKKVPVRQPQAKPRPQPTQAQPVSGVESPVVVTTQTTKTTSEAAYELHQLRSKISLSPDEMWRTLDARDRILRSWGGAGSRVKVGGATIGTCQDMCPEKELLHRQAEHQIMLLETDSAGVLEPRQAVKQYSRSSADQEIPMCYELRPAPVLMRTCSYLLQEVADTTRQISLSDWFHFMWDRFRGIRKDIAQQALCCAESINLVEMCARFHAHCAARLADLEHTQFDQKLNTDNLTKCLQTLKHMYADVTPEQKPREAEFRGYIALLNLGDANFWWEIKQLPQEIQKSEPITFAIKVFNALDNNNYVRFFRLVKENATYLQACILLRYFNDVRARALARIVKAYAPRGGSRFPAADLISAIAFESIEKMKAFINHYGLRFAKSDEYEFSVILDRNQFIEDSDPFATSREIKLIESKRKSTVGQVIAGGNLPKSDFIEHTMHTSFTKEGRLKETALVAEEQNFNTVNDSNKNIKALKAEIEKLANGGKPNTESSDTKTPFVKPDIRTQSPRRKATPIAADVNEPKLFTFKPAITVASNEIIANSPEKTFDTDEIFSFSKPEVTDNDAVKCFTPHSAKAFGNIETKSEHKNLFTRTSSDNTHVFGANKTLFAKPDLPNNSTSNLFTNSEKSVFGSNEENKPFTGGTSLNNNLFSNPEQPKSLFGQNIPEQKKDNAFSSKSKESLFSHPDIPKPLFGQNTEQKTAFSSGPTLQENMFSKPDTPKSVFGQISAESKVEKPKSVFGQSFGDARKNSSEKLFGLKPLSNHTESKQAFVPNNIFASANDNLSTSKLDSAIQFGKGSNIFAKAASHPEESNQGSSIFTNSMQKTGDSKGNIFAAAAEQTNKSNSIFSKPVQISEETKPGNNIFANSAAIGGEIKPTSIFGAFNKQPDPKNIFANPDVVGNQKASTFASNGEVPDNKLSPGSFFKGAINPPNGSDPKGYSIFQSKNKAQTVADNIYNSVMAPRNDTSSNVYEFNQEAENDEQKQTELQRIREEKIRQEEEKRLQEKRRREEEKRQEELRRQVEERRKAEEKRKAEENRLREEQRRLEEQRKKEELRKKLEEEKAEQKRKAEEELRKIQEAADKQSSQLVEELLSQLNNETCRQLLKEEHDDFSRLMNLAGETTDEIISILSNEICIAEIQAEFFLTRKIMRKWFDVWRSHYIRNINRRKWLDDTPVWLPNRDPIKQASYLRRRVEDAALKSMNAFHRGYKFSGELKLLPPPEPYNIMEIIRSPLLKRMKQICYPYDKCFFWKVTLISPGANQWLYRKINIENWLMEALGDKKSHPESETLIHVGKYSWNRLMDFAISVSLAKRESKGTFVEAVEGTNGILFYSTENDKNLLESIVNTVKNKYANQVIPVAVIMPRQNEATHIAIQTQLAEYVDNKIISGYKVFVLDPKCINESLNTSTRSALKWIAKKCPEMPPIEIDYLKSICQRYLGNELWCKFRAERDSRMRDVLKDIQKLINCYNAAVDKLAEAITNEELFNYPPFPLELKSYLEQGFPYPKGYEFIPSNVRTSENVSMVRDLMKLLKLPNTLSAFKPQSALSMQQQIRSYCNQIAWFEDPEKVVSKVVAVLPHELSDLKMSGEDFIQYFSNYDLIDFLNIIIYEKINCLNNFDNRYAVYEKSVLQEFCNMNWLYEVKSLKELKHKVIDYEDETDYFIKAKRRKIAMDSLEYLMLEDNDTTLVETSIQESDADISKYSECSKAVKQLEEEIEEGTKKSVEFENMLRAALADV